VSARVIVGASLSEAKGAAARLDVKVNALDNDINRWIGKRWGAQGFSAPLTSDEFSQDKAEHSSWVAWRDAWIKKNQIVEDTLVFEGGLYDDVQRFSVEFDDWSSKWAAKMKKLGVGTSLAKNEELQSAHKGGVSAKNMAIIIGGAVMFGGLMAYGLNQLDDA
jgi:hypothetical protein